MATLLNILVYPLLVMLKITNTVLRACEELCPQSREEWTIENW